MKNTKVIVITTLKSSNNREDLVKEYENLLINGWNAKLVYGTTLIGSNEPKKWLLQIHK